VVAMNALATSRAAVPVLGTSALILMILALGIAALIALRRTPA
jgi:hypothetical protein